MLQKNENAPPGSSQDETPGDGKAGTPATATLAAKIGRGFIQLALMAIVLGVALAVTMRLVATKPEVPRRPVFPAVYTVDLLTAKADDHQPLIRAYGEIVAARSVDLRSLVGGEITAVNPKLKSGGEVEQGEVLISIDRFNFEGGLREAEANAAEARARIAEGDARIRLERSRLSAARDQLQLARNDLSRIEQLRRTGAATEKQVEDRRLLLSQREQSVEQSEINIEAENARLDQLKASMERLNWKVEQARRDLDNTQLTAPFAATVRSSTAELGKLVSANDVVVSMYQDNSLEVRFVLTDERFGRIQADGNGVTGRPVEVTWHAGGTDHRFKGEVDRIGAEISSSTGGVELFAPIDASNGAVMLRPGAFVEVSLPDRLFEGHFRIPESSLYDGNRVYVAVDGELEERNVAVAARDGAEVLVSSGLSDGDEVLVTRISEIGPGLKVRREGEPETPSGSQ